jgi:hypothetical protein
MPTAFLLAGTPTILSGFFTAFIILSRQHKDCSFDWATVASSLIRSVRVLSLPRPCPFRPICVLSVFRPCPVHELYKLTIIVRILK